MRELLLPRELYYVRESTNNGFSPAAIFDPTQTGGGWSLNASAYADPLPKTVIMDKKLHSLYDQRVLFGICQILNYHHFEIRNWISSEPFNYTSACQEFGLSRDQLVYLDEKLIEKINSLFRFKLEFSVADGDLFLFRSCSIFHIVLPSQEIKEFFSTNEQGEDFSEKDPQIQIKKENVKNILLHSENHQEKIIRLCSFLDKCPGLLLEDEVRVLMNPHDYQESIGYIMGLQEDDPYEDDYNEYMPLLDVLLTAFYEDYIEEFKAYLLEQCQGEERLDFYFEEKKNGKSEIEIEIKGHGFILFEIAGLLKLSKKILFDKNALNNLIFDQVKSGFIARLILEHFEYEYQFSMGDLLELITDFPDLKKHFIKKHIQKNHQNIDQVYPIKNVYFQIDNMWLNEPSRVMENILHLKDHMHHFLNELEMVTYSFSHRDKINEKDVEDFVSVLKNSGLFKDECLIVPDYDDRANQKQKKKLFVSGNHVSDLIIRNHNRNEHQTYFMESCGEVLTPDVDFDFSVRTGKITYQYCLDSNTVQQSVMEFPGGNLIEKVFLEADTIQQCMTAKDDFVYILFENQLKPGQYTRLFSVHPNEYLIGIRADMPVDLFHSPSDCYFYAVTDVEQTITFVVAVQKRFLFSPEHVFLSQENDPLFQLVQTYRNPQKGFLLVTDPNQTIPALTKELGFDQWCHALFEERAGACWHRVLSVYQEIKRMLPQLLDRVSIEGVNNNHVVLRVLNLDGSMSLVDLGGSNDVTVHYTDHPMKALTLKGQKKHTLREVKKETKKETKLIHKSKINQKSNAEGNTTLLISKEIDREANFLLNKYRSTNVFYLDHSSLLSIEQAQVYLNEEGEPYFLNQTPFALFLQNARNCESVLLIKFCETVFDTKQRAWLTAIINRSASEIMGMIIPENLRVIVLSEREILGFDHIQILSSAAAKKEVTKKQNQVDQKISFDLSFFSDWKKAFFGRIRVHENKMTWLKSDFVLFCESVSSQSSVEVLLTYCDKNQAAEINYFLNQSRAKGYFDYHGYHIPISEKMSFVIDDDQYDFSNFDAVEVFADANPMMLDSRTYLINKHIFDRIYFDKKVEGGVYFETKGIFEYWYEMHQDEPLCLFITESLSDQQWWCLLSLATKFNLHLQLLLSKNIELPKGLAQIPLSIENQTFSGFDSSVYLTNDTRSLIHTYFADKQAFHVEDYDYTDLFFKISYEKGEESFQNFRIEYSDVLNQLLNGETVILAGRFSPELLGYIQTMLLPRIEGASESGFARLCPYIEINADIVSITGRLILVVEDQRITANNWGTYLSSDWCWYGNVAVCCFENQHLVPNSYVESFCVESTLTEQAAISFLNNRVEVIQSFLQNNAMLQLIGETGVGKSKLIDYIQNNFIEEVTVYRELSELDKWAADCSQKTKILFIDESNIAGLHFTMFESLKRSPYILYNQKIWSLSGAHKVIFASNPCSYGGGRVTQKLFSDGTIPQFHFSGFSFSYIYFFILKPLLPESFLNRYQKSFERFCVKLLQHYVQSKEMTVRELQQSVLRYYLQHGHQVSFLGTHHFFTLPKVTHALGVLFYETRLFLEMKRLQKMGRLSDGVGLNGLLIDTSTYSDVFVFSELFRAICTDFIYIDPALSLDKKEEILLFAWENGRGVFMPHVNTCVDNGLEKVLNRLLTESSQKPGFFFIGTVLPAHFEGVSLMSPAMRHRCVNLAMPSQVETSLVCRFTQ